MPLRRAALVLLSLAAACHPAVRGRCVSDTDCRAGSACSSEGLCVNLDRPTVQVVVPAQTTLSPSAPRVLVHVEASPQVTLGALAVVVASGRTLATGSLATATAGDNTVTLAHLEPNAVGQVAVTATLQFSAPGGPPDTVGSDPAVAFFDSQAPSVNVFVPATSDTVNGWVPRTTGTLEVRAQVDDGAGSGPASATLQLDKCPPSKPCSYAGAIVSRPSASAALFSFAVPREVQAAGKEAPVTGVIVALDVAQNAASRTVSLQIDDAPPALGPVTVLSASVKGEDGHGWFSGGASAAPVEISLVATDAGAGLLDLALHLEPADVSAGTPDPAPQRNADGSFHFLLPAAAVSGREGALRFTVTARDALLNTAVLAAPAAVFVDDDPPMVRNVAVNYATALPALASVCAPSATVMCGRVSVAGGPPDHLLRDDVATVTFDAQDCGAGLPAAGSAALNGLAAAVAAPPTASATCPNSNPVHHYAVQLDLSTQSPGAPDLGGNEKLPLDGSALDLLGHRTDNRDVAALLSIVRWRSRLIDGVSPAGSPALLVGASPRPVVVGNSAAAGTNLFILDAKGATQQAVTVGLITSDVAVDKAGVVYAAGGIPGKQGVADSSQVSLFDSNNPAAFTSSCPVANAAVSAPLVLAGTADAPLAVLVASPSQTDNVFVFQKGGCTPADHEPLLLDGQTSFSGITAEGSTVFFAHGAGFTSSAFANMMFDQVTPTSYAGTAITGGKNPAATAGPAISGASPSDGPLFAGSDKAVHKAKFNPSCTGTAAACWEPTVNTGTAAANLVATTPVFDANGIYAADSSGTVYAFSAATDKAAPLGRVAATTAQTVSTPVLVGNSQALVVQRDATVRLLSPLASTGATLLQMTKPNVGTAAAYPPGPAPVPTPVVDARGTGGVAYIPDGNGWVWAVQLDQAPVAASATAWPRPGRDSCNSRNATASYCP